jgi:hypothetical protein
VKGKAEGKRCCIIVRPDSGFMRSDAVSSLGYAHGGVIKCKGALIKLIGGQAPLIFHDKFMTSPRFGLKLS